MINPVEYLKMVHTVITTFVSIPGVGWTIARNANRIGLSISKSELGSSGLVELLDSSGAVIGDYGYGGPAGDCNFTWLLHGTLPSESFHIRVSNGDTTITIVELILRPYQTDQIANG